MRKLWKALLSIIASVLSLGSTARSAHADQEFVAYLADTELRAVYEIENRVPKTSKTFGRETFHYRPLLWVIRTPEQYVSVLGLRWCDFKEPKQGRWKKGEGHDGAWKYPNLFVSTCGKRDFRKQYARERAKTFFSKIDEENTDEFIAVQQFLLGEL